MKRESFVFLLGFVLILTPFLGIPSTWKHVVYVVLGAGLIVVGYQLRRIAYLRSIENHTTGERRNDAYVEHVEPQGTPVAGVSSALGAPMDEGHQTEASAKNSRARRQSV